MRRGLAVLVALVVLTPLLGAATVARFGPLALPVLLALGAAVLAWRKSRRARVTAVALLALPALSYYLTWQRGERAELERGEALAARIAADRARQAKLERPAIGGRLEGNAAVDYRAACERPLTDDEESDIGTALRATAAPLATRVRTILERERPSLERLEVAGRRATCDWSEVELPRSLDARARLLVLEGRERARGGDRDGAIRLALAALRIASDIALEGTSGSWCSAGVVGFAGDLLAPHVAHGRFGEDLERLERSWPTLGVLGDLAFVDELELRARWGESGLAPLPAGVFAFEGITVDRWRLDRGLLEAFLPGRFVHTRAATDAALVARLYREDPATGDRRARADLEERIEARVRALSSPAARQSLGSIRTVANIHRAIRRAMVLRSRLVRTALALEAARGPEGFREVEALEDPFVPPERLRVTVNSDDYRIGSMAGVDECPLSFERTKGFVIFKRKR